MSQQFQIPVIINNFNRLSTTKRLVEDLKRLNYNNIHILDNNSTYEPLLEWYRTNPCTVELLGKNLGQLAIYNSDYINKFNGWVAYSDSDIELNPSTPSWFIDRLIELGDKYKKNKVGLALRIDDLPGTLYGQKARDWEAKYWVNKLEEDVYEANVDTTFCIIKVGLSFEYTAIRVAGDYTARHIPWYLDYNNLSEEEQFVINNSSNEFSTTKRFVDSHKNQL